MLKKCYKCLSGLVKSILFVFFFVLSAVVLSAGIVTLSLPLALLFVFRAKNYFCKLCAYVEDTLEAVLELLNELYEMYDEE